MPDRPVQPFTPLGLPNFIARDHIEAILLRMLNAKSLDDLSGSYPYAATYLSREGLIKLTVNLSLREITILVLRFGLDTGIPRTLKNVGEEMGVTTERIRQIESWMFARMREIFIRHPDAVDAPMEQTYVERTFPLVDAKGIRRHLVWANIFTENDLTRRSASDLLRLTSLTPRDIERIKQKLADDGLELARVDSEEHAEYLDSLLSGRGNTRTCNRLARAGIKTLADLLEWSESDLLSLSYFGERSLSLVRSRLKERGLALRDE